MSQFVESNRKAFKAGAAIAQYLRVKLSSGLLAAAAAADGAAEIGTLEEASFASADVRFVRLRGAYGTRKMVASGAISAGAAIFPDAGGKITATQASNNQCGIALEAAAANNDVIECIYEPAGKVYFSGLTDVTLTTPAQGDVMYFNGTAYVNLAQNTSGKKLTTAGPAANPSWT